LRINVCLNNFLGKRTDFEQAYYIQNRTKSVYFSIHESLPKLAAIYISDLTFYPIMAKAKSIRIRYRGLAPCTNSSVYGYRIDINREKIAII
jgi:hypothetical protein